MQLTRFTDFGLRVLMYLTQCRDRPAAVTIPAVSYTHLTLPTILLV